MHIRCHKSSHLPLKCAALLFIWVWALVLLCANFNFVRNQIYQMITVCKCLRKVDMQKCDGYFCFNAQAYAHTRTHNSDVNRNFKCGIRCSNDEGSVKTFVRIFFDRHVSFQMWVTFFRIVFQPVIREKRIIFSHWWLRNFEQLVKMLFYIKIYCYRCLSDMVCSWNNVMLFGYDKFAANVKCDSKS